MDGPEEASPTPKPRGQVPPKRKRSANGENGTVETQAGGGRPKYIRKEDGEWRLVDDDLPHVRVWGPKKRQRFA
jgi:hypothetical protein